MGMYTHQIKSQNEPDWLHEYSPCFEISDRSNADFWDSLCGALNMPQVEVLWDAKCFIYDEDIEMFEATMALMGVTVIRL